MSDAQASETDSPARTVSFHRTELFASLVVASIYLIVFALIFFAYVI